MKTIGEALARARALGVARLDAQALLGHRLQRPRAWLIAHDEAPLPPAAAAALAEDLERRAAGVPLAYLTGVREFRGLELAVNPAVLVPRPETEELVDWALECLDGLDAGLATAVADLGTGSGAIALALKHARPALAVTATDASAEALAVAQGNARRLALAIECLHGDWWAPLAGRRFALVVSNPPYIADDDPHLAALADEPRAALTPEGDGLAALRVLAAGAPAHLLPGGSLLVEHGFDQGPAVRALFGAAGLVDVRTRRDLAGHDRCTGGRRPA